MKFNFAIGFIIICYSGSVYSQADTQFWFAPPATSINDKNAVLRIIASERPTTVTLFAPAMSSVPLIMVELLANELKSIYLADYLDKWETYPANEILKTGLYVHATDLVSVHYDINDDVQSDLFNLKGGKGIGTKFTIPSQSKFDVLEFDGMPSRSFDIVATNDNTVVRITPSINVLGHSSDIEFGVLLNKGETYSVRNVSSEGQTSLAGSYVESNKPIAITLSENFVIKSLSDDGDYIGDQLLSDGATYTNYIIDELYNLDGLYITAIHDNTQIEGYSISDSIIVHLDRGETFNFELGLLRISSSKPVHLISLSENINSDYGELGLAVINGIGYDCEVSSQISFYRAHKDFLVISLVGTDNVLKNIKFNGLPFSDPYNNGIDPENVPHSDLSSYSFGFSGDSLIQTGKVVVSSEYGSFTATIQDNSSYIHLTSYKNINLPDEIFLCTGEDYMIEATLGMDSYLWSDGSTDSKLIVTEPGIYWLQVTIEDCVFLDTILVDVKKGSIDLGPDQTLCEGETMVLDKFEYAYTLWSDGTEDRVFNTTVPGIYWIMAVDQYGCESRDTIQFFSKPYPTISLMDEIYKCREETLTLTIPGDSLEVLWSTGSTLQEIQILNEGLVYVEVNRLGCIATDSTIVRYKSFPQTNGIEGSLSVCPFVQEVLYWTNNIDGIDYSWEVIGGEINRIDHNNLYVDWGETNSNALVALNITGDNGCIGDPQYFNVRINPVLEVMSPIGEDSLCLNLAGHTNYQVGNTNGSVYDWHLDGGTIIEGQGTNSVDIRWEDIGTHILYVTETSTTIDTVCAGTSPMLNVWIKKDDSRIDIKNVTVEDEIILMNYMVDDQWNSIDTLEIEKWTNDLSKIFSYTIQLSDISRYIDVEVETGKEYYEYRVNAINSCFEKINSTIHNSLLLELEKDSINSKIYLDWNNYENWEDEGYTFIVYYKLDNSNFEPLVELDNTQSSYVVDGNIGFEHKFIVEARYRGSTGDLSSFSNFVNTRFDHRIDFIPNVITPNYDNYNETFVIPKIELYPNAELLIVNRWGDEVYRSTNYKNNWPMTNTLVGVYYYALFIPGQSTIKGVINVLRHK